VTADPATAVPLAAFAGFAREHGAERLYAALADHVVAEPALAALLLAAPPTQRKPVLWFAALHDRLLALGEAGSPLPPLAAYFASLGGQRAPDERLLPALRAFLSHEDEALREAIASRSTQTNEVGRCAVLWPALSAIAQAHGGRPLALFDFGCSAGLNLSVDAMRVRFLPADGGAVIDAAPGDAHAPELCCQLVGGVAPPLGPWRITQRLGADPAPVDLDDARAVRWLRACLWPSEAQRHERFIRAVALARRARHPLQAAADTLTALEAWLPTLPPGTVPVLFNSWVLAYFTTSELTRHTARVRALVQAHGLVWLSAEDNTCTLATTGLRDLPARPAAAGTPTWWALTARSASGEVGSRLLACSHPHGQWLQWLAG
jgi:hypothetical protein